MDDALDRSERGPDATVRATAAAWERLEDARAVVLVEGVSDQVAVETAADVTGRDFAADGVVVMPIGGAHAIRRTLPELRRRYPALVLTGLCDAAEADEFRRAADDAGVGQLRFSVCVDDLEDELVRAAGPRLIERVLAEHGDRQSFATLRAQPHWRDRPFEARFRRFTGAGSDRKRRYAAAVVRALGPDDLPQPLVDTLARVT